MLQQKRLNFFFKNSPNVNCKFFPLFPPSKFPHIATFFSAPALFTNGNKVKFLLRIHACFTSKNFEIVTQINKSIIFTSNENFPNFLNFPNFPNFLNFKMNERISHFLMLKYHFYIIVS